MGSNPRPSGRELVCKSMIAFAALGFFVGAVFGLRFKVYILVPTTFFIVVGSAVSALAFDTQFFVVTVVITAALDLGYVGSSVLRLVRTQSRTARLHPAPVSASKAA